MISQMHLQYFRQIEDRGVEKEEMYKTFNMGIGFCLIAPKNEAEKNSKYSKNMDFQVDRLARL